MTISGAYLSGATVVDFGTNNPGTIVGSTPSSLVVTIPAGTLGSTDVTVTTNQGTSTISMADKFTYLPLPVSSVVALPASSRLSFTVNWSGTDVGGPGIASYDIFVSDDGGAFTPFLTGTTQKSATFSGVSGHTYGFYSVAIDDDGIRGAMPSALQATTQSVLDPAGEAFWTQQLANGATRDSVAFGFANSTEREGQLVEADYEAYLGRSAGSSEIAFWIGQFSMGGTNEDIVTGFVSSDEFFQRATN